MQSEPKEIDMTQMDVSVFESIDK